MTPRVPEGWEEEMQRDTQRRKRDSCHVRAVPTKTRETEELLEEAQLKLSSEGLPDDFLTNGMLPVQDDSKA